MFGNNDVDTQPPAGFDHMTSFLRQPQLPERVSVDELVLDRFDITSDELCVRSRLATETSELIISKQQTSVGCVTPGLISTNHRPPPSHVVPLFTTDPGATAGAAGKTRSRIS
ncbi:unnamed protein product [Pleuronectes platessa]|uniref:Uncharacterized protein n=1 Tax=Pleuronectes platessa TaxID=8262 RepID=A0A9N7VG11_PLEPL|nr:unnamed protein product [Pleuronectes platessa]